MAKKSTKSAANSKSGLAAEIGKRGPFESLQQETFLNMARTFSVLNTRFNQFFKAHKLTSPQYNVLRILHGHGGPVSVYQIADEMITPQSDMPRLIDRMEARHLVTKTRCDKDRRVMWVDLTRQGRALVKKIAKPLGQLHSETLEHLTDDELRQLSDLLWLARHPKSGDDTEPE